MLKRPVADVRAVWLDARDGRAAGAAAAAAALARALSGWDGPRGPEPPRVLLASRSGAVVRVYTAGAPLAQVGLLAVLPQPGFAASLRAGDGVWSTVRPAPWPLDGWRVRVLAALGACLLLLAPLAWLFPGV